MKTKIFIGVLVGVSLLFLTLLWAQSLEKIAEGA